MQRESQQAVEAAIEAAGSLTELARRLSVDPRVVWNWKARGVPPTRVIALEAASGVPRHVLRPDLYPDETS